MIALLTGHIAHKTPDHIILDVHGVGYRVHIPFSTYYELPEEGGTASLHIHTSVREDAILLYGFRTRLEKSFFQLLIAVSGVGPKLARDILSNIQPGPLAQALSQGDLGKLSSIPGIGKKTAERLVLELNSATCCCRALIFSTSKKFLTVNCKSAPPTSGAILPLGRN